MDRVSAYDSEALDLQLQGVNTVFAPTDSAFRALGRAQMDAILNNNEMLTKVRGHRQGLKHRLWKCLVSLLREGLDAEKQKLLDTRYA